MMCTWTGVPHLVACLSNSPTACLLVKEDMLRVGTALRNIGWMR